MPKTPTQTVYFTLLRGLRGCYMPDEASMDCATSYREFCRIIKDAAEYVGDNEHPAISQGQHRFAWEHLKANKDWHEVCVYATRAGSYGLTVSPATLQEYETWIKENEEG